MAGCVALFCRRKVLINPGSRFTLNGGSWPQRTDLEASDPGLDEVRVGQALARGLGEPIASAFPLRLIVSPTDEDVQETIRVALDECARAAAMRARWDRNQRH